MARGKPRNGFHHPLLGELDDGWVVARYVCALDMSNSSASSIGGDRALWVNDAL